MVGNVAAAEALLNEMVAEHVAPDVRAVNTFMRGCIRVGDIEAAHRVFRRMHLWDVQPDGASFKLCVRLLTQVGSPSPQ